MVHVPTGRLLSQKNIQKNQDKPKEVKKKKGGVSDSVFRLWQGSLPKLKDFFIGLVVAGFVFLWVYHFGPDLGQKVFPKMVVDGKPNFWIYVISDIVGLLLGPAIYYLFFPSVEAGKTKIGFLFLIAIAVIVHGILVYQNKTVSPPTVIGNKTDIIPDQMAEQEKILKVSLKPNKDYSVGMIAKGGRWQYISADGIFNQRVDQGDGSACWKEINASNRHLTWRADWPGDLQVNSNKEVAVEIKIL